MRAGGLAKGRKLEDGGLQTEVAVSGGGVICTIRAILVVLQRATNGQAKGAADPGQSTAHSVVVGVAAPWLLSSRSALQGMSTDSHASTLLTAGLTAVNAVALLASRHLK